MKKVEAYPHETPTMFMFRFEKELAELEAIDPELAQKHYNEVIGSIRNDFWWDTVQLCFWMFLLIAIVIVPVVGRIF
jgi:hypothetical protein